MMPTGSKMRKHAGLAATFCRSIRQVPGSLTARSSSAQPSNSVRAKSPPRSTPGITLRSPSKVPVFRRTSIRIDVRLKTGTFEGERKVMPGVDRGGDFARTEFDGWALELRAVKLPGTCLIDRQNVAARPACFLIFEPVGIINSAYNADRPRLPQLRIGAYLIIRPTRI